jgi:O-antigen ligase
MVLAIVVVWLMRAELGSEVGHLAEVVPSPILEQRTAEVARFLNGDSLGGTDLQSRLDRYEDSWLAFAESPLLGVAASPSAARRYQLGGHTEWLDLLAAFGVLGSWPLPLLLVLRYRRAAKMWAGSRYQSAAVCFFLCLLGLGFVNPVIGTDTAVAAFVVVPLLPWALGGHLAGIACIAAPQTTTSRVGYAMQGRRVSRPDRGREGVRKAAKCRLRERSGA